MHYRQPVATQKPGAVQPLSRQRNHRSRGQALVEFSLVTMIFFLLAFALIDFSWMQFNQMNMQDAVREAGRYAATGAQLPDPSKPGVLLSRYDSISNILYSDKAGAHIDAVSISSVIGGVGNPGGPGDTVTISVTCDVPLLTTAVSKLFGNDNKFHFTVTSTFKNEPFPPSGS